MRDKYIIESLQNADSEKVARLLVRLGMEVVGESMPGVSVYESPKGYRVLLPTDKSFSDYATSLFSLLKTLQSNESDKPLSDWFSLFAFPDAIFFNYKIGDPVAEFATLPMNYLISSVSNLFDYIRYTASRIASPQPMYTKLPEQAAELMKGARAAQTEPGSYIIRLMIPENPLLFMNQRQEAQEEEPFGRQVVSSCMDNLRYIGQVQANPDVGMTIPQSLGRQAVQAIVKLRPPTDFVNTSVDCDYVTPIEDAGATSEVQELKPLSFTRAEEVAATLERVQQEHAQETHRGTITNIHFDETDDGNEYPEKRVTLEIKPGGKPRKLVMRLTRRHFNTVLNQLGDERRDIVVSAVIDKNTTPWSVINLLRLEPYRTGQQNLFG